MSCYHCYSKTARNDDLVDKIIGHGERLKNSMIKTILNNQPTMGTIRSNAICFNNENQLEKIQFYLRGDPMNKDDELQVLDTLRSISATELSKITDQTYTNRSSNSTYYHEIVNNNNLEYLKSVDCLKININSIKLNGIGQKKVFVDQLTNITQTFFIEYRIPEILIKNTGRIRPNVRLCARRSYDQELIIFKHSNIYDIVNNLNELDLDAIQIKFKISYRNFRQKQPQCLGNAIFSFKSFKNFQQNLCSNQELIINCDHNQFNVGKLKISIQFGCGRVYFGKECLEIINKNLENIGDEGILKKDPPQLSPRKQIVEIPKVVDSSIPTRIDENSQNIDENSIIFYLIYVLEARFSKAVRNSFINCQMFDQDLYFSSKLCGLDTNPFYHFHQEVPLIYNEDLLMRLRDNFMLVEFNEKNENQTNSLIGLAKLSLHPFYLSFRNSVIVKYLKNKHLPVIGTDGWETISNPFNNDIIGQASILVALGTKEQIDNLLNERGLNNNVVKSKLRNQAIQVENLAILEKSNIKSVKTVGVQSDDMEHKDIGSLLNQLINVQKQRNIHVENSTNTDVVVVNQPQSQQQQQQQQREQSQQQQQQQAEIRRTSDLLDTLHKALSLDNDNNKEKKTFKCQILIDSALHLPSRKKCKSKKSKNKTNKHEDILPSTYVTFEITTNNIKITPIITKCTNPKWDYRCDVVLPVEYLTNNQKRLIFKVWRKSTNTTLTPNLQTDFIIGFATVDLTVLLAGLPNIQGWYNIVDFSDKCHGQINIHITPLENISHFQQQQQSLNCCSNDNVTETTLQKKEQEIDNDNNDDDDDDELLSRTLKRKFIELDGITQRLRLRLSKVTNDDTDDTLSNDDELIDEFEHDINTLCVEDDFDMVNFEKEAKSFNENHIKEIGLLQQTLQKNDEKQQKIDNLVENLSINDSSTTRYVSGCSNTLSIDTELMLDQLEQNSRPNIHTTDSFNRILSDKYNWPSTSCSESSDNNNN